MVEQRENFRFALKTRGSIVVSCERWRQNLDGEPALQPGVGGSIDLTHTACPDLGGDFMRAKAGAGSEGQSVWIIESRRERGGGSSPSPAKWRLADTLLVTARLITGNPENPQQPHTE